MPAKERELGRTPDLPKVAYLYYMCTYICRTTRALSHTPCGAVASTLAVDRIFLGGCRWRVEELGYEGRPGLMCGGDVY